MPQKRLKNRAYKPVSQALLVSGRVSNVVRDLVESSPNTNVE